MNKKLQRKPKIVTNFTLIETNLKHFTKALLQIKTKKTNTKQTNNKQKVHYRKKRKRSITIKPNRNFIKDLLTYIYFSIIYSWYTKYRCTNLRTETKYLYSSQIAKFTNEKQNTLNSTNEIFVHLFSF